MQKIEVSHLKVGLIIGKQVIAGNTVLLENGTILTADHIKLLKNWNIPHIFIIDNTKNEIAPKKKRQLLNIPVKKASSLFKNPAENFIPINDVKTLKNLKIDFSHDPLQARAGLVNETPVYNPAPKEDLRSWAAAMHRSELAETEDILEVARKSKIQENAISRLVQKLLDGIKNCPEEKLVLTNVQTPENYLVAHSVNVCILSLTTALAMNLSHDQVVNTGISAIVHDLGMAQVDPLIWQSNRVITDEEYFEVMKHTVWGADMLSKTDTFCGMPSHVSYQHHERCDGNGYPKGKKERQINIISSIVACADVFAALISDRPYRKAYSDQDALLIMDEMAGSTLGERPLYNMISQAEMYDLVEKRPAKNILVIDSDTKTISMIREILKHPRVVIYSSQNAKLALAFLTDMMPDVIVVDFKNLDMPMKSFLNELYSIEGSENCSLVVASSNISKQDVNNRFSLGIDDYVLKPFNPSYFKQKILSFIGIGALQASRPHILNQE